MSAPGWLTCSRPDLPGGERWLSERERAVLAGLRFPKRRADWQLGRWAGKRAVAARLGVAPARIEVLASPGGAPVAYLDGRAAPVSLSLSHRGDRALAVVADSVAGIGCDLEVVEPRSGAFVREWLAAGERQLVHEASEPSLVANLLWTAKEAAAKTRGEGLRLDVRHAVVQFADGDGDWRRVTVSWPGEAPTGGWWRSEPGWVMAVTAAPDPAEPVAL